MIVILERKVARPILLTSTLSINMVPLVGSMIRKSPRTIEDFPAPVLPATPIFSAPCRNAGIRFQVNVVLRNYISLYIQII